MDTPGGTQELTIINESGLYFQPPAKEKMSRPPTLLGGGSAQIPGTGSLETYIPQIKRKVKEV